ncbi:MAG: thiamine pyrophosphate-dependent enzyme, partial [Glaciihabitans sp.]
IVNSVAPEGTVICGDSSQVSYLGTGTFMPQSEPRRFLYMPTYATLGYGLPAAIGAKIAAPELPVLCLLGDGALMFSIQELVTAVEQQVDITIVCVDNGGYREIRQNMLDRQITPVGVDLTQPDWVSLAKAFGLVAFRADHVDELSGALAEALAVSGPSFVHLRLN